MSKFDDAANDYINTVGKGYDAVTTGIDNAIGVGMAIFLFPFWCLGKLIGDSDE